MEKLTLEAVTRTTKGKAAAKEMRKTGSMPAVMYNTKGEATMLSINEDAFEKVQKQATPTTIIELVVDGKKYSAFIKDAHYNILSEKYLHVDFHVIEEDKILRKTLKVQTTGNPVGVRAGGFLIKTPAKITIECLPKDLPIRIVANINDLAIGSKYKIKDIPLAKGIKVISDPEAVVAAVKTMR